MKTKLLCIAAAVAATAIVRAETLSDAKPAAEPPRVRIVATTFPIYDWTREVLGEKLAETDLVLLQQSGVDLHSYSPSAADLRKIASCDLFVFVGGESDEWTERALAQKGNPRRRVLNLVKALGSAAKEEKVIEGMEHEHHHEHAEKHDHDEDHDHDHAKKHDHDEDDNHDEDHDEHEIDEHVWLSLRHAATLVKAIAAELAVLDPANAAMKVAKSFRAVCIVAAVFTVVCSLAGILTAVVAGTPVGSTIVAADIVAFLFMSVIGRIIR